MLRCSISNGFSVEFYSAYRLIFGFNIARFAKF